MARPDGVTAQCFERFEVEERVLSLEGGNIVVSIPDVPNPDEVIDAVGTTAQLQFRPVNQIVGPSEAAYKQDPFKAVDDRVEKLISSGRK